MTLILLVILAAANVAQYVHFKKKIKKLEQDVKLNAPVVVSPVASRSIFSIMYGNP